MPILTINAGSSSIKLGIFKNQTQTIHATVDGIGTTTTFQARTATGQSLDGPSWPDTPTHEQIFAKILPWAQHHLDGPLRAAGHRVVHGGRVLIAPTRIDANTMAAMAALIPLAPLHQPHCLAAIRAVTAAAPDLPQIACFDTAFHRTMPEIARRFAIPRALHDDGIERYGFHGLSYEYIASRLQTLAPARAAGRVIVAHLGSGASLCALQNGKSMDTTMGLTALDGLPMATRCGSLDPGVLLYLLQEKRLAPDALQDLLYHHSGLLGVSGESANIQTLSASKTAQAAEAMDLFAYQIARQTAALACSLGGLDAFVFTAGIGEHSAPLREKVCTRLAWLGAALDHAANAAHAPIISSLASKIAIHVIPTDEEAVIARHTADVVK